MASTVTLAVGQTVPAVAHEWSGLAGTGVDLGLEGTITWSTSDPAIATVDAASGLVTGVGPGDATITAVDGTNNLTGFGVVTDTPLVRQSLTVDFPTAPTARRKR